MSIRPSTKARNRLIAITGVAIIGVGITLGPYGLLIAGETECV